MLAHSVRARQRQTLRAAILESARTLLAANGAAGLSLDQLALQIPCLRADHLCIVCKQDRLDTTTAAPLNSAAEAFTQILLRGVQPMLGRSTW